MEDETQASDKVAVLARDGADAINGSMVMVDDGYAEFKF